MSETDTLRALQTSLAEQGPAFRRLDGYYRGKQRLAAMGLSLPPEMRGLLTIVNWPRVVVDSLERRIDLREFRMFGAEKPDDRLWSWWQANNLSAESSLAHTEAFRFGRGYVSVGFDDDDPETPLITVESARSMIADVDTRTRKVRSAARFYDAAPGGEPRAAVLYLDDRYVYCRGNQGKWTIVETIEHPYERVPIVPIVNRSDLDERDGWSEMHDVIPITDAACRNLTNLQGAQELMAVPSRYVFGMTQENMKDSEGNPITEWEGYLGRFNLVGDPEGKVVQLPAADLRNFTETTNGYARLVSSVTGIPAHQLGLSSENPASADAIRSAEAGHVKLAERKTSIVGSAWVDVMRLALMVVDGQVPDEAKRMEAVFGDCATPTYAAKVDAVVKLYGNGSGLLPREAAWEELGYSPAKRERLAQMVADDPQGRLLASMGVTPTPTPPAQDPGILDRLGASPTDGVTA